MGLAILLGLLSFTTIGLRTYADEKSTKEEKRKVIKLEKANRTLASKIDFEGTFALNVPGVGALGTRIEAARTLPNPIALILLAGELRALEEVSGKKASLTAAELMKEAKEAVVYRNQPDELRVAAKLLGKETATKLLAQAEKAQKVLEARAKAPASTSKGITGSLIVVNKTRWYIKIYVNDTYKGVADPYSVSRAFVGDSSFATTKVYGEAPGTGLFWGPKYYSENINNLTLTLD
jgi:hypothetical protein